MESFSKFSFSGHLGQEYEVVAKSIDSDVPLFSYPRSITCSLPGIDQVTQSLWTSTLHLYKKSYNNI